MSTMSPRDTIIDALVERGCAVLEVTWVEDAPNPFSMSSSKGGMWAATYRRPESRQVEYATGRFLGQILTNLDYQLAQTAEVPE